VETLAAVTVVEPAEDFTEREPVIFLGGTLMTTGKSVAEYRGHQVVRHRLRLN
jgi:hypothetical protein